MENYAYPFLVTGPFKTLLFISKQIRLKRNSNDIKFNETCMNVNSARQFKEKNYQIGLLFSKRYHIPSNTEYISVQFVFTGNYVLTERKHALHNLKQLSELWK